MEKERIKLELGSFDCELILKCLKEEYYKKCGWGVINNGYPEQYGYVDNKKSKQLGSTIRYIEKQMKEQQ